MADKTWKAAERAWAAWFGTTRIGPQGDDGVDFENEKFAVQCKWRSNIPKWLRAALDNGQKGATDGRFGIALLKEKGTRYEDSIVLIALKDLKRLTNLEGWDDNES